MGARAWCVACFFRYTHTQDAVHKGASMIVNVKFFAGLRDLLPEGKSPCPVEMPMEATVGELLNHFGVEQVPGRYSIVVRKGQRVVVDNVLKVCASKAFEYGTCDPRSILSKAAMDQVGRIVFDNEPKHSA